MKLVRLSQNLVAKLVELKKQENIEFIEKWRQNRNETAKKHLKVTKQQALDVQMNNAEVLILCKR